MLARSIVACERYAVEDVLDSVRVAGDEVVASLSNATKLPSAEIEGLLEGPSPIVPSRVAAHEIDRCRPHHVAAVDVRTPFVSEKLKLRSFAAL
jgi:hypothetical protein